MTHKKIAHYLGGLCTLWIVLGTFFPMGMVRLGFSEYHLGPAFFNPMVGACILLLLGLLQK